MGEKVKVHVSAIADSWHLLLPNDSRKRVFCNSQHLVW